MNAAEFPNNERRIIYYEDHSIEWSFMRFKSDPDELKAILEQGIDELAEAGVDTVSVVSFSRFFTMMEGSTVVPEPGPFTAGYARMAKGGYDTTEVWIDRCHQHGMEYIATLRMNDRHSASVPYGQFIHEHPEWQLTGLGGGPPGMDYTHEPVRQTILAFIEELLDDHDVDGIELDWMRHCHMFPRGEGAQKAHLLTDFTRKTRELLDAAGQRRGRKLPLGVRVPQTLEECDYLGFDVASWIKEGLVDYVIPSDFLNLDANIKVEEFVKLTEGTDCKVYPALFPWPSYEDRVRVVTLAQYRAAAQNFYAYGADGVQFYNYQVHWQRRYDDGPDPCRWLTFAWMWPKALDYFREVRDPQMVSQGDRHYLFYPIWPKKTAPTGLAKDTRIKLNRAQSGVPGTQDFRVAEDLSNPKLQATLLFKAVDMTKEESLEIWLNGTPVLSKQITRRFQKTGQNEWQGVELAPFYLYIIDIPRGMAEPLIINGDNELTVRLIPTEGQSEGTVTIDELEVYVYVREAR